VVAKPLYEQQQQFKTDQGQGFGLRIFFKIPRLRLFRFLDPTLNQEVPKLFSQQPLRGLVDKATAQ
jgi:hypothetical protein